jgi:hypothetical protein
MFLDRSFEAALLAMESKSNEGHKYNRSFRKKGLHKQTDNPRFINALKICFCILRAAATQPLASLLIRKAATNQKFIQTHKLYVIRLS